MGSKCNAFLKRNTIILVRILMILFICSKPQDSFLSSQTPLTHSTTRTHKTPYTIPPLETLKLDGHLEFDNIEHASKDFGNRFSFPPKAVLYPNSVSDIAAVIKHVFNMGSSSNITIAARGHGHSLQGQSQAHQGIVINMESLKGQEIRVHTGGESPFVDVSGGELWINLLHETLKHGLAPKSWTDYLHLTIGGTLSNGGISGQAFRHGPQINNVHQLQIVTGKGEVVTCSEQQNSYLFHGVLGGLGQFGIITRARISLERAPEMVRWVRMLYSDFSKFSHDQEHLISSQNTFDYIEGFVNINRTDLLKNWRSSFRLKDPLQASQIITDGRTLYCLEVAKYYCPEEFDVMNKKTEDLLSKLSFIPSTVCLSEVPYVDFLERVHSSEKKLREKGLWDVPHPWINLMVPKAKISHFAQEVFGNILTDSNNGPILIYPVNKSKWNNKLSLITPEEDIFYLVAFLSSAVPSSTSKNSLEHILTQNQRILDFCTKANLGIKQYLPHYRTQEEWKAHFGSRWEVFAQRKTTYDPLAILAPGHRIFQR